MGYSLGMVKMEAFDDSHFMHHTVRGGHTQSNGSIVSLMACIFDLKKKFYVIGNSSKLDCVCGLPWYGENGSVRFKSGCKRWSYCTLVASFLS